MSLYKIPEFGWGGLNTRAASTGLPLLECVTLQDMRVVGKDLIQRRGIYRVQQLAGTASAMDFVPGSSQYCTTATDVRVWTLGLRWTLEFAMELDTTSGTMGILTVGSGTPALIVDVTGGNIRLRVWDSAASSTTVTVGVAATSVQTVQVTRDGATLTTRLNNGTAVTGTMSATLNVRTPALELRVGRDDSTNYFDGTIDYVRLYSTVRANHADRLIRNPAPRSKHVLADYDFNISAGLLVYDRSRYGNHLVATNTPTEIATLCHNPAPIRGLSQGVDTVTNKKQLLALAGGACYVADLD